MVYRGEKTGTHGDATTNMHSIRSSPSSTLYNLVRFRLIPTLEVRLFTSFALHYIYVYRDLAPR